MRLSIKEYTVAESVADVPDSRRDRMEGVNPGWAYVNYNCKQAQIPLNERMRLLWLCQVGWYREALRPYVEQCFFCVFERILYQSKTKRSDSLLK